MALVTLGLCWTSPPLLPSHRSGHLPCLWPLDLACPSMLCHQLTYPCSAGHSVHSFSVQCRGHTMSNRNVGEPGPSSSECPKAVTTCTQLPFPVWRSNSSRFHSQLFSPRLRHRSEGEAGYRIKPQGLTWIRSPHLF